MGPISHGTAGLGPPTDRAPRWASAGPTAAGARPSQRVDRNRRAAV